VDSGDEQTATARCASLGFSHVKISNHDATNEVAVNIVLRRAVWRLTATLPWQSYLQTNSLL